MLDTKFARTRTARRIGTRRDGSAREIFSSRRTLFSFHSHFLRTRLLGITDLKRKGGLQAVYEMYSQAIIWNNPYSL